MTVSYIPPNIKSYARFARLSFSLPVLLLLVTFSGCFCPDDVVIGELSLTAKSIWPFEGSEDFTYINKDGEELVFKGSSENAMQIKPAIIMERMCSKPSIDYQDAYYTSESFAYEYHLSPEIYLAFIYMVSRENNAPPTSHTDTILYETFRPSLVNVNDPSGSKTNCFFRQLVSDRGNTLANETIQAFNDVRTIADTTLNGVAYQNLFCHSSNPGLFYSNEFGVVLFNHDNDWWYLKRP
jgi:hypothetical protein